MTNGQKQGTPKRLIIDHCSLIIERQRRGTGPQRTQRPQSQGRVGTPALPASAALPYSPNSSLPPQRSASVTCNLSPVTSSRPRRAAFSLAEILIAIFVLSIGLIMIAAVFPVAAKWTAQDAQTSIAQVIAKNAVATLQAQYSSYLSSKSTVPYAIGPFAYSFGSSQPYPAPGNLAPYPTGPANLATPPVGQYYWTAIICPAATTVSGTSGISSGAGPANGIFTVAIFVFSKGDANDTFPTTAASLPSGSNASGANYPAPYTASPVPFPPPLPIAPYLQYQDFANPTAPITYSYYPQVFAEPWRIYTSDYAPDDANFPMGSLGFDATRGEVFRKITDVNNNIIASGGTTTAVGGTVSGPQPQYDDEIIFAPPAIGQTSSPLIYVYVTTVSL
jgi:hypothetical protein